MTILSFIPWLPPTIAALPCCVDAVDVQGLSSSVEHLHHGQCCMTGPDRSPADLHRPHSPSSVEGLWLGRQPVATLQASSLGPVHAPLHRQAVVEKGAGMHIHKPSVWCMGCMQKDGQPNGTIRCEGGTPGVMILCRCCISRSLYADLAT